jgi:Maltokinase N-terminal cap domain
LAVIHRTTMVPGKRDLLTAWLPKQDWYLRHAQGPSLARAGGFRLDDPDGEVGIEFDVARDDAAEPVAAYLVPMTYRGSPLAGADAHLIGTAEHGVLGKRWIYDGTHDPVLLAQLAQLIQGHVRAQSQSQSETHDPSVHAVPVEGTSAEQLSTIFTRLLVPADLATGTEPGQVTGLWAGPDGTLVRSVFANARQTVA